MKDSHTHKEEKNKTGEFRVSVKYRNRSTPSSSIRDAFGLSTSVSGSLGAHVIRSPENKRRKQVGA